LKEKLPAYMIPSAFVLLEAIPLTANGKVDRQALPAPLEQRPPPGEQQTVPQTELEQTIAVILQEVLGLATVGLHDNFFDLGGTSVHMVQAHAKLCQAIGKIISITELFTYPTIYSLAEFLGQDTGKPGQPPAELKKIQERSQKQRQAANPQQERLKRMRRGNE
jgi:acyl carrier protein